MVSIQKIGMSELEIINQEKIQGKYKNKIRKQLIELDGLKSIEEDDVKKFETRNNITLPATYRQFLLLNNGGYPDLSRFSFDKNIRVVNCFLPLVAPTGYYDSMVNYISVYADRYPSNDMLPIASSGGGDMILVGYSSKYLGKIYYWNHNFEAEEAGKDYFENIKNISSDFNNFLNILY